MNIRFDNNCVLEIIEGEEGHVYIKCENGRELLIKFKGLSESAREYWENLKGLIEFQAVEGIEVSQGII